jgi:hypothetical protein
MAEFSGVLEPPELEGPHGLLAGTVLAAQSDKAMASDWESQSAQGSGILAL